jgi:hypothetical protein
MKRVLMVLGVAALLLAPVGVSLADSDTALVSFQVDTIRVITVSGNPEPLHITTAAAGSAPTAVTDSGTSYDLTVNEDSKITAEIDSNMPSGVTLSVTLTAPSTGTSAGKQSLSTTAVDVVTGITAVNQTGMSITYELAATAAAGAVSSDSRTVTYTVVANS